MQIGDIVAVPCKTGFKPGRVTGEYKLVSSEIQLEIKDIKDKKVTLPIILP